MMYLLTWESKYDSTSIQMLRTREAAEAEFGRWVTQSVEGGDFQDDTITLYTVDDEHPDITIREDKTWYGDRHGSDDTPVENEYRVPTATAGSEG